MVIREYIQWDLYGYYAQARSHSMFVNVVSTSDVPNPNVGGSHRISFVV
jgi:hypothetical protein